MLMYSDPFYISEVFSKNRCITHSTTTLIVHRNKDICLLISVVCMAMYTALVDLASFLILNGLLNRKAHLEKMRA